MVFALEDAERDEIQRIKHMSRMTGECEKANVVRCQQNLNVFVEMCYAIVAEKDCGRIMEIH
jgi:hypothetical protein